MQHSNPSDEQIREHFATFHRIYREKLHTAIPPKYQRWLRRIQCISSSVTVYVSLTGDTPMSTRAVRLI